MANDTDVVINRVVAIIIDSIILWVVMLIIALPFGAFTMMMGTVSDPLAAAQLAGGAMIVVVLGALISLGYFIYFEGTTGQTIGKRIANIKVVRMDGKPMTYMDALIRTILRIIDGIFFYLVGLIIIVVSKDKQRLGDMAAKTLVVKA
ncbi:MAG: RDD family protein [Candidatus Aenigmatarchaeota archaeon]|nr:MAG: RDD family protein [Candidatus Aenigmarchaeota archaeon]